MVQTQLSQDAAGDLSEARHALTAVLQNRAAQLEQRDSLKVPDRWQRRERDLLDRGSITLMPGGTDSRIRAVQHEVLSALAADPERRGMRSDPTFVRFARNMCIISARFFGWSQEELRASPEMTQKFVEHLVAHYQLLRERISPSTIRAVGHRYTLWEVGRIVTKAQQVFGTDPISEQMARTATTFVLLGKYDSIEEAKQNYGRALRQATRAFGGSSLSAPFIRAAAFLVFSKRYDSVAEVKERYSMLVERGREIYGSDRETLSQIHRAAREVIKSRR